MFRISYYGGPLDGESNDINVDELPSEIKVYSLDDSDVDEHGQATWEKGFTSLYIRDAHVTGLYNFKEMTYGRF